MRPVLLALSIGALCLFATFAPLASAAEVPAMPLVNASFAEGSPGALPAGWRVVEGGAEGVALVRGAGAGRADESALRIASPSPRRVTVESEPLSFAVGHLYRVSAWVRTLNAFSDPRTRYPTAVPACISMASFPFTNHSSTAGATRPWTRVESLFIATRPLDSVRLHLGKNGTATGVADFDDVRVEKVDDPHALVPRERVRWHGPAYRYDDLGWIFVHVEGEPYERGFQHGALLADEIAAYANKLAHVENKQDPQGGWEALRFMADAMLKRKFDPELLTEMRGIADGVRHAGVEINGAEATLLDIVTLNAAIDIDQMRDAIRVTPHALSGQSFLAQQEEMAIPDNRHRCSAFTATGPATATGEVVFGQIFMWNGYTGVHWNVLMDLAPDRGHRVAYQTFPGGIHSGADFYINDAGIVIGETTVAQTPYEATGTPQSDRIRRAAQYASSIDDVTRILTDGNNGMYTNDWPLADVKTGEVGILLLGTHRHKLWRTGEDIAPFGIPGFLWSNNNNRDPGVRREYVTQPEDAPYDLAWAPWNRDVAFQQLYRKVEGRLDEVEAAAMFATSPINRAHACDGKITTTAMAKELVFLAHHGKVTLREKFPEAGSRRMPDLPGAVPHLALGYATASPKWMTASLREARESAPPIATPASEDEIPVEFGETAARFEIDADALWRGTIEPASDAENWLASASAASWHMLRGLAGDDATLEERARSVRRQLDEMATRFLYTVSREGDLAPLAAKHAWDRYAPYRIPRVKGTFALHQLRLALGNEVFLKAMREAHEEHRGRKTTTAEFLATLSRAASRDVAPVVMPWLERTGLPAPRIAAKVERAGRGHRVVVDVTQDEPAWTLETAVEIETAEGRKVFPARLEGARTKLSFEIDDEPIALRFDPFGDIGAARPWFYAWPNIIDEFDRASIVFGTTREIEAQHTMADRFQTALADAYLEILPPLVKDSELSDTERRERDLIVIGGAAENVYAASLATQGGFELGRGYFRVDGVTYDRPEQGLFLVVPNPEAPERVVYLVAANSALQLWRMTKSYRGEIPSWAIFEGDTIERSGYHAPPGFEIRWDKAAAPPSER